MKNNDTSEKQVYGVTGMPLAGKTAAAKILEKKGYQIIDMGDVVREERSKRNIPVEKTGDFVNRQRKQKGMDAVAQLTIPYIKEKDSKKIVITGMRGLKEKERFEEELNQELEMIAVWASPNTRKTRRENRMREEDQKGDSFHERDLRELENGVGELMALSQHIIKNESEGLEKLEKKIENILEA